MTAKEIKEIVNVPLSTLDCWKHESHPKHKLYLFLINSSPNEAERKTTPEKKNHRFYHILNRNSYEKYDWNDINNAFKNRNHIVLSEKDKLIHSKFFKECDPEELEEFTKTFSISKRDIKQVFINSSVAKLDGVAKVWRKRFRISCSIANCVDVKKTRNHSTTIYSSIIED